MTRSAPSILPSFSPEGSSPMNTLATWLVSLLAALVLVACADFGLSKAP